MTAFLSRFNRECFASLFMLTICIGLQAQNLVPNPGFEDYTNCPEFADQLNEAFPWISPTAGSTDLYNSCAGSNWTTSVPNNWYGHQYPNSGNGYAGFYNYGASSEIREYIQTNLETPLEAGVIYWVSFYVNLADISKFATNNFGAHFSESPISSNNAYILDCCIPQVNATDVISSKTEWTLISGCFTALGNELYMTIGNFYSDENTTVVEIPEGSGGCYYFIDDVYVSSEYTLGEDKWVCEGDSVTLNATVENATYVWQDNSTNSTFTVTETGTYWVEATTSCGVVIDTINVYINPFPTVELGNDTTLCEGELFTLDVTTPNATYLWQDNSTNPILNVTEQGTYWVEVFLNNCSAIDTIEIVVDPIPTIEFGNDTTLCDGDSFTLDATTQNATYLWQDNSANPTFYVSEQGTYWVEITNSCGFASDTIDVQFNPLPTVELGSDTTLCEGEKFTLDVTTPNATYLWQDNSTDSTFNVTQQGSFWVELTVKNCSAMDSIQIDYNPIPTIQFGNDIALCEGDTITLDVTTQNATYLWQDNSTNSTFQVTEQGTYWVEIANSCGIASDSINVFNEAIPIVEFGNDTTLCKGDTIILDVTITDAAYLWQDNSTNSTLIVFQGGDYWVVITNNCGSASDSFSVEGKDCEVILEIPNVFTPNNDGKNDSFSIISNNIISMNTVIYNRWGNKVFETNNLLIEWSGEDASDGTYFYTIQYTDVNGITNSQSGYVTLLK